MRVVVTGASGFLGQGVVKALLNDNRVESVVASDRLPLALSHSKLTTLTCDLHDRKLFAVLAHADAVVHLAATLGGAAEADPDAARKINLDATLNLMARCKTGTRFVFASSLAVLGAAADARAPTMIYGAHKAMAEIAIETATRRGEIDGISLRPGGIVARAGQDDGLKSAFLSRLFWAVSEGANMTLPVSPDGQTWLASVSNVANNFVHAALADELGAHRSLTLPMMAVRFSDLVYALKTCFPDSQSQIGFTPDSDIMRLFGTAQALHMTNSLSAGFKADLSLASLIENAMHNEEPG